MTWAEKIRIIFGDPGRAIDMATWKWGMARLRREVFSMADSMRLIEVPTDHYGWMKITNPFILNLVRIQDTGLTLVGHPECRRQLTKATSCRNSRT